MPGPSRRISNKQIRKLLTYMHANFNFTISSSDDFASESNAGSYLSKEKFNKNWTKIKNMRKKLWS